MSFRADSTIGSTNSETSPPIDAISLTREEDKKEYFALGVKNILSKSGDMALFILAIWNSYSKSDTALNPLTKTFDHYCLAKSTIRQEKTMD